MFFDICHDKSVHYDIVSSMSMHRCRACGSKWYCEVPGFPRKGEKYVAPYWVEAWSWKRLWKIGKEKVHGRIGNRD